MVEIIPAIIPESLEHLRSKLLSLQNVSNKVQIDITDGMFVMSRSWPMKKEDQKLFEDFARGKEQLPLSDTFSFEVDLMMHKPETVLEKWVKAGIFGAIFHIESRHNFGEIKQIAKNSIELGVAIQNKTPLERLESYIDDVDFVQVMGIETLGRQGEVFSKNTVETVKTLKEKYPGVTIQIDGGVNEESAPLLIEAGANRLVSGSYILRSENPRRAIETLQHGSISG